MTETCVKKHERQILSELLNNFLAAGGRIDRIENTTVESLEASWKQSLPSGMKARLERQQIEKLKRKSQRR